MTISTTHSRKDYVGNGVLDTYPFDFPVLASSDLRVYVAGVLRTLGIHYTVTGTLPGTGNVVFAAAYIPAAGAAIIIEGESPLTQATDLNAGEQFYEEDLEQMVDKTTVLLQQLKNRSPLLPSGSEVGGPVSLGVSVALGYLRWNLTRTAFEAVPMAGVPSTAAEDIVGIFPDIVTIGPWVDPRAYGTFALALAGAAGKTLLISSVISIDADTTIPADVDVMMLRGGSFSVASGKVLTINGPFESGLYQVFNCAGTGKVVFGSGTVKEVYPEWWETNATPGTTDMADAIQAAADTYRKVRFQGLTYAISKPIESEWVDFEGAGVGSSLTPATGKTIIQKTTHTAGVHADVTGWSEHYNVDSVLSIVAVNSNYSKGWSLKGVALSGISTGDRNTYILYAPRVAQFHIANVDLYFGTTGFYSLGAWDVRMDHFRGASCNKFIHIPNDGFAGQNCTSWVANNLAAVSCADGVDIFGMNYSTFNSCYMEGTTGIAWKFSTSKNIVLNASGGEQPTGQLLSLSNSDVLLNGWQSGQIVGVNAVEAIYVSDSTLTLLNAMFQDFSAVNGAKNMAVVGAGSPSIVMLFGNSRLPVSGSATTVDGFSKLIDNRLVNHTSLRGKTDVGSAFSRTILDSATAVQAIAGVVTGTGQPVYSYSHINDTVIFTVFIPDVVASGAGSGTVVLDIPFTISGEAFGTAHGSGASGKVTKSTATRISAVIVAIGAGTTDWYLFGSFQVA